MSNTATVGTLRILLTGNSAEFDKMMNSAQRRVGEFSKGLGTFGRQATDVGRGLTTALTLPLAGVGVAASKLAIDFESSFAGVRKTVNATEGEFATLAQGFRDLSKTIPINVNELNKIGEAAGQLGIKKENILGFTDVMAKLGVTTNLSADQAATSLARLANITQMPQSNFDRLGATIVDLGNNLATTESEIVDFGLRIAGAGKIAGMSEAEILSIGAAMSSIGVQAEAGGTAVQKVLNDMTAAVATGNKSLAVFASTAGMSAQEFADAYRKDAAGAFTAFVEGLGQQGEQAFTTLDTLKLGNERVIRAFLSLAGAGDLLSDSIKTGTKAWEENTALTEEARKRFETTEAKLTLLWNRLKDVGITLGDALLPVISDGIGLIEKLIPKVDALAKWFAELSPTAKTAALGIGAFMAAIGPALIAVGQVAMGLAGIVGTFGKAGAAAKVFGAGIALLTSPFTVLAGAIGGSILLIKELTGSWAIAVGVIAPPLGLLISRWGEFKDAILTAKQALDNLWSGGAEFKTVDVKSPMAGMLPATLEVTDATKNLDAIYKELNQTVAKGNIRQAAADQESLEKSLKATNDAADELNRQQDRTLDVMRETGIMTQQVVATGLAPLIEKLNLAGQVGERQFRATLLRVEPAILDMAKAMRDAGHDASWLLDWFEKLRAEAGLLPTVIQVNFKNLSNVIKSEFYDSTQAVAQSLNGLKPLATTNIGAVTDAFKTLGITSRAELGQIAENAKRAYQTIAEHLGKTHPDAIAAFEKWQEASAAAAGKVQTDWFEALGGIRDSMMWFADTSITFAERVANAVQGIYGTMASTVMSKVTELGDALGKKLSDIFGAGGWGGMLSGFLGNIVSGGISALAGLALQKIGDWIGNLINKPSMRANDDRDAAMTRLAAPFGGTGQSGTGAGTDFAILAAKVHEATGSNALFERFLKADTPQKFAAALREVEAALASLTKKTGEASAAEATHADQIEATRKQYADKAAEIEAGIVAVNRTMTDMAASGTLTDETREQLELQKAAYQQALKTILDEGQAAINTLASAADTGVGTAAAAALDMADDIEEGFSLGEKAAKGFADFLAQMGREGRFNIEGRVGMTPEVYALGGGDYSVPQFDTGTDFSQRPPDFGGGTLAMLHRREHVVPEGRIGEFVAQHGGGGQPSTVNNVTFAISALDGADVRRVVESREFRDSFEKMLYINPNDFGHKVAIRLGRYQPY